MGTFRRCIAAALDAFHAERVKIKTEIYGKPKWLENLAPPIRPARTHDEVSQVNLWRGDANWKLPEVDRRSARHVP